MQGKGKLYWIFSDSLGKLVTAEYEYEGEFEKDERHGIGSMQIIPQDDNGDSYDVRQEMKERRSIQNEGILFGVWKHG